jgi:hypothetical protein
MQLAQLHKYVQRPKRTSTCWHISLVVCINFVVCTSAQLGGVQVILLYQLGCRQAPMQAALTV